MAILSIRAKFHVIRVEQRSDGRGAQVYLGAVYKDSDENSQFFEATPSGYLSMFVQNQVAADFFAEGAEVYIDFTPADKG